MAHTNVALNFNAFLEKTKMKDDGSNYMDWVWNLRIILIAAKKAYVIEAPLVTHPFSQELKTLWMTGSRAVMITPWFSAACFTT